MNDTELYAVPEQQSIIDMIDHKTGLTRVLGRTEADVLAEYPDAVRMTFDAWQAAASARQRTPINWKPSTAEQFHRMLNILPPAAWIGGAFLVGEPTDHDVLTGAPRYAGFLERHGYFTASRPMTIREFRQDIYSSRLNRRTS